MIDKGQEMKWRIDFRIWHWVHALVVLGLLGTVFLRKTFLSWRTNSEILTEQLFDMDIEVTLDQAKVLAKSIRAPMWDWHIYLGYALAGLLLYRVVLFFTHKTEKPEQSLHKKMVKLSYLGLYALLAFMSISGFVIHFYQDLGLAKTTAHDIKEIHELLYNLVMIFVVLHITGVLVAENRDEKGIISDMINGGKE